MYKRGHFFYYMYIDLLKKFFSVSIYRKMFKFKVKIYIFFSLPYQKILALMAILLTTQPLLYITQRTFQSAIASSTIRRTPTDRPTIRGKRFNSAVGGIMLSGKIGRTACYNRVIERGHSNDRTLAIPSSKLRLTFKINSFLLEHIQCYYVTRSTESHNI